MLRYKAHPCTLGSIAVAARLQYELTLAQSNATLCFANFDLLAMEEKWWALQTFHLGHVKRRTISCKGGLYIAETDDVGVD